MCWALRTYSQTMTAARRRLLLANGVFLVVVGGVQVVFELLAYYAMGIAATVVHFVFVAAHTGAFAVSREKTPG